MMPLLTLVMVVVVVELPVEATTVRTRRDATVER
jgi:hypothetical protein